MEFLLFESLYDTAYQLQVYELLKKCDQEFVPPLSQRTSTTQRVLGDSASDERGEPRSYFRQLCGQSAILAVEQGRVLGFMSYRERHVCEDVQDLVITIYVTTIIVDPPHRGQKLTQRMYQKLLDIAQRRDLPVSTRTWSTNDAHIKVLSRLGFYELLRIRDGRGQGIDTVYFRKDRFHYEKESDPKGRIVLAETEVL